MQNYFGDGGPPHRWLTAISELYPLSFHSVGLSLGSADGLNTHDLDRLAILCDLYQPASVSDHLSFLRKCTQPLFRPVARANITSHARLVALIALIAKENCTLGNLLTLAFEVAGEQVPLEPILYLIGAGALVKTG